MLSIEIIHNAPFTPKELKARVEESTGRKNFFNRGTMNFFGDTMRNYGVRTLKIGDDEIFELYRKKPVNGGLFSSTYFHSKDYRIVSLSVEVIG